ncbi:hypothetical protein F0267_13885 [Vibrio coralliilyticus]|uniref:Restriction system protein Mrr-like N-terminal domain-containing protein n=1 Tax=Vibrio coralliilyticus TaxID=190893 RepID=A0AAN0SEI4_9VIBR|nr:hypothetical protein [Vibrio coralliilyticus]AIW21124.1 hypothetical protein IX92_19015 [Vibrio coralliilyticus]NOH39332.1 hypothetical protein [Vibrio coralliilyticus]
MAIKNDLQQWVCDALEHHGGEARLIEVSRYIWQHHEAELRVSGDLFYTWQYYMRWAATQLRKNNTLKPVSDSPRGIWKLSKKN